MFRYGILMRFTFLGLAASMTLACGSGSRQIQSVTVSPASADAQDYPDGKVPFVATGHYDQTPVTVTPLQANWGPDFNSPVSIDQNGVAQCAAGASGTYSIGAWVDLPVAKGLPCPIGEYGESVCGTVLGTAQLTCP
jgi:hypothetical protein